MRTDVRVPSAAAMRVSISPAPLGSSSSSSTSASDCHRRSRIFKLAAATVCSLPDVRLHQCGSNRSNATRWNCYCYNAIYRRYILENLQLNHRPNRAQIERCRVLLSWRFFFIICKRIYSFLLYLFPVLCPTSAKRGRKSWNIGSRSAPLPALPIGQLRIESGAVGRGRAGGSGGRAGLEDEKSFC